MWKLRLGANQFDWLVILAYQMNLFFGSQMLFTIFLEYTPKTMCDGDRCFEVINKCTYCPDCPNLCGNTTSAAELAVCKEKYDKVDFYSPAMEYGTYCISGLNKFSVTTSQFLGLLVGNIFLGFVADKVGRRSTVLVSLGLAIPNIILSGILNDLTSLYVLRFLLGLSIGGCLTVGWTFCSELISKDFRFRLRTFGNYGNARLLMTLVVFLAGGWRLASILLGLLISVTFVLMFFLPESPIWLKRKGKTERAEKAARRIAYLKGVEYEPEEIPDVSHTENGEEKKEAKTLNLVSALKNPPIKVNILVLWTMLVYPLMVVLVAVVLMCIVVANEKAGGWFSIALIVYIIDLGGADMTANLWLGQFMSAILLSVGKIGLGFADVKFAWIRRRTVFLSSVGGAILAMFALTIFNYSGSKGEIWYFLTYLAGYVATSLAWEPCYMGASELIPTEIRATITSFSNIFCRIGVLLASQLVTSLKSVHEPALFMIAIAVGGANFFVAFKWLKETKNIELDTILKVDQENTSSPKPTKSNESDSSSRNPTSLKSETEHTETKTNSGQQD